MEEKVLMIPVDILGVSPSGRLELPIGFEDCRFGCNYKNSCLRYRLSGEKMNGKYPEPADLDYCVCPDCYVSDDFPADYSLLKVDEWPEEIYRSCFSRIIKLYESRGNNS